MSNVGYTYRPVKYKHSNPNRSIIDAFDYTVGAKVDNIVDLYDIPPEKINLGGLVYVIEDDNFYKLIDKSQIGDSNGWEIFSSNLGVSFTVITSGGNYHDTELTGNVIVLTNTNAQAIFTGFDNTNYKRITLVNNGDFESVLNNDDPNSLPENRIKLPTGLASIGVEGTCELVYVDVLNRWQITDAFASKYRPEHRGLTEMEVEVVVPGAKSETYGIIDYEVFRDAQSTRMTSAELNAAYPDAPRGTWIICEQVNTMYKKVKSSPSTWVVFNYTIA